MALGIGAKWSLIGKTCNRKWITSKVLTYGPNHEGSDGGQECKGRRVLCELEGDKFNAGESDDGGP